MNAATKERESKLSPSSKLFAFWGIPLFEVDGRSYKAIDVALAAMVRGEWSAFERGLSEGLACLAYAEHQGLSIDGPQLDAAADEFRYDRDLIAADDVNAWLERTGVSALDWQAYLTRKLLREGQGSHIDDLLDRFSPSGKALVETAFAEGVCSKAFEQFERTCAERGALAAGVNHLPPATHGQAANVAHAHAHWLKGWPADDVLLRLEWALTIESAFQHAVAALTSPERLADAVEAHKIAWRRIETDTLKLPTEHAAREALLCVTTDGMSLHEVGALCRRAATRETRFVDEIDDHRRDRLAGLDAGLAIGPFSVNGHFDVTVMLGSHLPTIADPEVAARAKDTVIEEAARHAARDRVRRADQP